MFRSRALAAATLSLGLVLVPAVAYAATDTEVTVGSDDGYFSHNKQNEPGLAVEPGHTRTVLAAGANDNIDLERCNAGDPLTCPFTPGVGVSGVQFSLNGGATWMQPTYTGWSARNASRAGRCPGDDARLRADGRPDRHAAVVLRERPGLQRRPGAGLRSGARRRTARSPGRTANGSTTRTSPPTFPGNAGFAGCTRRIAVSRTDNIAAAAAGNVKAAWKPPVIVTKQNSALFSDKEQVWADNAASSPYFGNVYVCNVGFRGTAGGPEPVLFARSTDGGDTWSNRQLTAATNNAQTGGRQGCAIRTDSDGVVYVVWSGFDKQRQTGCLLPGPLRTTAARTSSVRGRSSTSPASASSTRCRAGSPSTAWPGRGPTSSRASTSPTARPTGADATDEIVVTWSDDRAGTEQREGLPVPFDRRRRLVQRRLVRCPTARRPGEPAGRGHRPGWRATST